LQTTPPNTSRPGSPADAPRLNSRAERFTSFRGLDRFWNLSLKHFGHQRAEWNNRFAEIQKKEAELVAEQEKFLSGLPQYMARQPEPDHHDFLTRLTAQFQVLAEERQAISKELDFLEHQDN